MTQVAAASGFFRPTRVPPIRNQARPVNGLYRHFAVRNTRQGLCRGHGIHDELKAVHQIVSPANYIAACDSDRTADTVVSVAFIPEPSLPTHSLNAPSEISRSPRCSAT